MGIQNDIKLWDQVQVRVLDVRIISLETNEFMRNYVLPTSAFVYVQGRGQVWLDEEVWTTSQFLLLHGGKGSRLTLEATGVTEVHLILYKSTLPLNVLVEYRMMLNQHNPFEKSWATAPDHALELRELVRNIHECWSGQEQVGKIQVKVYFFQLVQIALLQRSRMFNEVQQPSLTDRVLRYIKAHYRESISLDALAQSLSYSPQYVSRKFKEQTGCTPTEYVIRLRIGEARSLLGIHGSFITGDCGVCGLYGPVLFQPYIQKETGITPGQYRLKQQEHSKSVSKSALYATKESIVTGEEERYPLIDDDNHYQYIGDEEINMFNQFKSAIMSLALVLTLSACGTAQQGQNHPRLRLNPNNRQW
ncbi:AraC family transcriptional regulator [Paenibacillus amylolyticus]|nr:AraC family transcriptional regulator [Paenibacillus amylolyticus]WFR61653.1 AraC family transcriptional regulator [Paenibacillus amylolyticus]